MERLINFFKPKHYQLDLNINKSAKLVQGHVIITGQQVSDTIKLHAKDLKIADRATINGQKVDFQLQDDIITFTPTALEQDTVIDLHFSFILKKNMEGAYLSTYQFEDREELIVATQFESHFARNCFPCVDEPEAKATFDLKIITPDLDDTVLSNMPIISEKILKYETIDENLQLGQIAQKKIVRFSTTPVMSTYLLAFALGKFQSKSTKTKSGISITSYCALNQDSTMLDFANQTAQKSLEYYEETFNTPYPLPKLDQLALPDFEAGAMENWGLITYRETCMLASKNSSIEAKSHVALVIAHEISHQWFGNLVTMRWWDDLWLNESFANIMEYYAVNHIYPEFQVWQTFFTGDCVAALRRDGLENIQSVHQDVSHPDEISTLFDPAIVYAKGARLILMLIRLIGEKQFFRALEEYFKAFAYQNTVGSDLWQSLQKYADFDISKFMSSWLEYPGYPVITNGRMQRFFFSGRTEPAHWTLPKIKDDMSGHFLLNLSDEEFQAKIKNFDNLNLEQKLRLLIDRQLLARTDLVSSDSLLDLLLAFTCEESFPIWQIIALIISEFKLLVPPDSRVFVNFKRYIKQLISVQLNRLSVLPIENESANDTKLRPLILSLALYIEDDVVIEQLSKQYHSDYATLSAELRYVILVAHLLKTQENSLNIYIEQYQAAVDPDIKDDLLSVITNIKQVDNIETVLKLLESPEIVRQQDHPRFLRELITNFYTRPATYDWFYQHWGYIKQYSGIKTLDTYIRVTASRVLTSENFDRFTTFFDQIEEKAVLSRIIEVAKSDILAKINWINRDRANFEQKIQKIS